MTFSVKKFQANLIQHYLNIYGKKRYLFEGVLKLLHLVFNKTCD